MRVLIAFDKFKDALTALQACETAARAIGDQRGDWRIDLCPLADGGEGFAPILTAAAHGSLSKFAVAGPRGGTVEAAIGLVSLDRIPPAARALLEIDPEDGIGAAQRSGDGKLAVIEMASASGLAMLAPDARDPWQATSLGTGQLIRAAAGSGARAVLLGVGGSATNDLGLGALSALGYAFDAADGRPLEPPIPAAWPQLVRIRGQASPIPPIRIACDVANPLLGPRGATAVFGPQKGLKPADFERLEAECSRVAALLCEHCGRSPDLMAFPGAGAAGGIAFGLMAAAGARLLPGASLVGAWLDLETRLAAADLIVTGEGRFDASSWEGKGPGALALRARALGKTVHIFAGQIEGVATNSDPRIVFHPITPSGTPLRHALQAADANLAASVQRAFSQGRDGRPARPFPL
jgi:glycerate kinase